jgi:carbamoylphosphate synthase large subunit
MLETPILTLISPSLNALHSATTIDESVAVAYKIGFPILVRAAFALGGLGSGFADNEEQLRELAEKG